VLAVVVVPLAAACVFLLAQAGAGVLRTAYRRYQERYLGPSIQALGEMFLFVEPRQLLLLNLGCMLVLALIGWVALHPLGMVGAAVLGFFLPTLWAKHYRGRRIRKFNSQLVDTLQTMAGALRAGLTFPQAAEQIAREMPAPVSQEFGLLVKEMKLGIGVEQALLSLGERVGSDDLDLVVIATNVSRQLGGNMAEMFETISATARERFRLEGKIDAMTAQGRMQGWIVAAMPLLLGLVLNYLRPDLMQPMLQHPFGYALIGLITVMEAIGVFMIRKIVNVEV
jgi:tight adherence protein B